MKKRMTHNSTGSLPNAPDKFVGVRQFMPSWYNSAGTIITEPKPPVKTIGVVSTTATKTNMKNVLIGIVIGGVAAYFILK